ncbi:MAG: O-antigen ligase family protein [Candidatus Gracilibacteria bacterium]
MSDIFYIIGMVFLGFAFLFNEVKIKNIKFDRKYVFLLFLFVWFCGFSLFFSLDKINTLLYFVRILMFFSISLLFIFDIFSIKNLFYSILVGMVISAFIGILQFILQHSVGLSLLGESVLSKDVLNVAKIDILGQKFIRAYSTFPHPNIFGGYLVFTIILMDYFMVKEFVKFSKFKNFLIVKFLIALIFSFSRVAILTLFVISCFQFIYNRFNHVKKYYIHFLIIVAVFLMIFLIRGFDFTNLMERVYLYKISLVMFFNNIFGVGIGNFTLFAQDFFNFKLYPWNLQPVHNVFVLIFNEIGIFGGIIFLSIWIYLISKLFKNRKVLGKDFSFLFSLVLFVIIIGLFDHYFWTLYSGEAILWIILGIFGEKLQNQKILFN